MYHLSLLKLLFTSAVQDQAPSVKKSATVSILWLFLHGNAPAGNTISEHMVGKLSGTQKRSWMTLNKWPEVALEMVSCILGC